MSTKPTPEKIASDVIAAWMGQQHIDELKPVHLMDLRDLFASAIRNLLYIEGLEWNDKIRDMEARIDELRNKLYDVEDEAGPPKVA